jgi:hypothetical protein
MGVHMLIFDILTYFRFLKYSARYSFPENTTLLLNKNIGDLLIGKDISADILEIEGNEIEPVLRDVKNLRREGLRKSAIHC